jgi:alcohol dehydrogenase
MIAVSAGARVVAVDVSAAALAKAGELGASVLIDAGGTADVAAAVRNATAGGATVSMDALGSAPTCRNSILGLAKRGRHIQVGLMVGPEENVPLPMARVIAAELEMYGSHGMPAHDYPQLLADVQSGRLAPGKLVTEQIGLAEAAVALTEMDRRTQAGITIVRPSV